SGRDRGLVPERRRTRARRIASARARDPRGAVARRCRARGLPALRRAHARRDRGADGLLAPLRRRSGAPAPRADSRARAGEGVRVICVSELAIDRLLAGELADLEATATRRHAASCTRCRALLDDAESTAARFAADRPPLALPRRINPAAVVAGVFAAAAALAVALWPHPEAGTRTNGPPLLPFYVSHAGDVRRGGAHEVVAPGDQLE